MGLVGTFVVRLVVAGLALLAAGPSHADLPGRAQPPTFEQRLIAILDAGGASRTVEARLEKVAVDPMLSRDQQIAVAAIRTLVRARRQPGGLSLTEAESFVRAHPGSPGAAVVLAEAALAEGQSQRAADLLIDASSAGPLIQILSPATVARLAGVLDRQGDRKRVTDLSRTLLAAGWNRGSAGLRSYLALNVVRDDLAAGRVEEARRMLPALITPASLHLVLIDNRLAPLRDDVVRIAGPRLGMAWRHYLVRTRDDWLQRGDYLSAIAYAQALAQAGLHEALADAFLARFLRGYNCPTDLVAGAIAGDLIDSLARAGRWSKAEDIMRRSGGIGMPTYVALVLEKSDFRRAANLFDRALRSAREPADEDEVKALAWLRAASKCASFRAGRNAALEAEDLAQVDLSARLFVLLCVNKEGAAKTELLSALADEGDRADALRWVQPFTGSERPSSFRQAMDAKIRSLQSDPEIIAAALSHGVILDWPITSGVPALSDLPPAPPALRWRCGEQSDSSLGPSVPGSLRLPDSGN